MKTKEARPALGTWSGKAVMAIRKNGPGGSSRHPGKLDVGGWREGGKAGGSLQCRGALAPRTGDSAQPQELGKHAAAWAAPHPRAAG